jgi:hypothetical protein
VLLESRANGNLRFDRTSNSRLTERRQTTTKYNIIVREPSTFLWREATSSSVGGGGGGKREWLETRNLARRRRPGLRDVKETTERAFSAHSDPSRILVGFIMLHHVAVSCGFVRRHSPAQTNEQKRQKNVQVFF